MVCNTISLMLVYDDNDHEENYKAKYEMDKMINVRDYNVALFNEPVGKPHNPVEHFKKGASNVAHCTVCGRKIPKDIRRIEQGFRMGAVSKTYRTCAYCISMCFNSLSKKEKQRIAEWIFLEVI